MIAFVIGNQKMNVNTHKFHLLVFVLGQVLKLKGEIQYRKTLITNNGSPTGAGNPVGIAVDPARG